MAVNLTPDALASRISARLSDLDLAHQLLAISAALVERYAAHAPSAVQNEATVRLAGWLAQTPSSDLYMTGVGPISMDLRSTPARAGLRSSGAMGILSMWHRPRASIIGADEDDQEETPPMQIALTLTGADILDLATARRVLVPATSATEAIRPSTLTVWKSGTVNLTEPDYGAHLVLALADSRGGPLVLPVTWDEMWQGRFGYLPDTPDLARPGSWRADYDLPSVGERQSRDEGRYFSRGVPLVLAAWRLGEAGARDVTPTDWEAALTFSADYRLTLAVSYEVLA